MNACFGKSHATIIIVTAPFSPSVIGPQIETTLINRAFTLMSSTQGLVLPGPDTCFYKTIGIKWIVTDKRILSFGMLSSGQAVGNTDTQAPNRREELHSAVETAPGLCRLLRPLWPSLRARHE